MEHFIKFSLSLLIVYIATSSGEYTDPHCNDKQVIVHLFEWKWSDVALECERFLSKKGFCGVQVSPVNEHIVETSPPRPWWERYQPVSYKLHSRSGTAVEFADMVSRCMQVGVRIYVDVVINHMAMLGHNGTGTAGSFYDADNYNFPGVPYEAQHFNKHCELNSTTDVPTVKNCFLYGLTDLDQSLKYVRDRIASFLNILIDYGVAGFRVDAARHMWPNDIAAIQDKVKDLPEGGRPFFYHEVYDIGNNPITTQQYTSLGYVTEFRYCQQIKDGIADFRLLNSTIDYHKNMTDTNHAFIFVNNHDNVRNKGAVLTFRNQTEYKMAVAFTLANDYGFTRVLSNYYFGGNYDLGPPHNFDYSIKDVTIMQDNISCGNGWVCEHRWRSVANMVAFRNAVGGTKKENIYYQSNQIAFSRGNKGFFAMARDGQMNKTLQTGLPQGEYCDIISECANKISVDGTGMANIVISDKNEPVVAFIVGRPSVNSGTTVIDTTSTTKSSVMSSLTTSYSNSSFPPTSMRATTSLTSSPKSSDFKRTVILIERQTKEGQDLFIRGGFDKDRHPECAHLQTVNASNPCVIPIKDRYIGNGLHYAKYNAWSVNDNFLDWEGAEPRQGRFHDELAQGTPAVWTTNKMNNPAFNAFNGYGDHFWLVDIDMNCNKTEDGWFEFKAVVNGQWEDDIYSGPCIGAWTAPATTKNHWAKCGMMNIYHFSDAKCEIKNIP